MQSADFGDFDHRSQIRRLLGSRLGRVLRERYMGSGSMIILAVAFQNPAEMIFIDHDHMVEALSPEASNHPLNERILPGTPGRRDHFFDPHPLYPPAKLFPVNLVAISDQKPRSTLFGESFNHLL